MSQTLNGDNPTPAPTEHGMVIVKQQTEAGELIKMTVACMCGWKQDTGTIDEAQEAGVGHLRAMGITVPHPSNAPLAPGSPQGRVEKVKKEEIQ